MNELNLELEKRAQGSINRGYMYERVSTHPREAVVARRWEEACEHKPHINHGYGTLQDLFFKPAGRGMFFDTCIHEVTDVEKYVVATVVQWLGSNIGMNFIESALRDCGYRVIENEPQAHDEQMPGAWTCDHCNFIEQASVLNAHTGGITANNEPFNRVCPNDGKLMRPLTWRETNQVMFDAVAKDRERIRQLEDCLRAYDGIQTRLSIPEWDAQRRAALANG